ncbi:hypothetical protein KY284_030315 [Solanum tuberosum]|nr:hypothetical protein KY284_030315 [Solanum tuberosum]
MEGVPIIKFGDHIATEVSVQECHDKVKPISIHNSQINISSHRKGNNSREQMELLKTINILVNDSESYCANSKSPAKQPKDQLNQQVSDMRMEKKTVSRGDQLSNQRIQMEIPQSPNEVRHDILIHKESKVEQLQSNDSQLEEKMITFIEKRIFLPDVLKK